MKTGVTTLSQSDKLKEIGFDQTQGASSYTSSSFSRVCPADGTESMLTPDSILCAAYTLEQLMHVASTFVGNHGFPAQIRSHMVRKDRSSLPEKQLQYLYSYKDISFVIEGNDRIEVMTNLILCLNRSYHVNVDAMNKSLIEFNAAS